MQLHCDRHVPQQAQLTAQGSYPLLPLDVPGDYDASFNLTGFPLVCPLASHTCSKTVCLTKSGPLHEPIFMHVHLYLLITSHIAGSLNCCYAPRGAADCLASMP